jgi:RND superfamily putative drug exporter
VLTRLAAFAVRHRRGVMASTLAVFVLTLLVGSTAATSLSSNGGFADPKAQSLRASVTLQDIGAGAPGVLISVTPLGGTVSSPTGSNEGGRFTTEIQRRAVAGGGTAADVISYWNTGLPSLRSADGRKGLMVIRLSSDPDISLKQFNSINDDMSLTAAQNGVSVQVGGAGAVFTELGDTIKQDLVTTDSIAIPITGLLLVLIFGSAVAATLPLIVGLLSVFGSLTMLRLLVLVTPVSVYATNLAQAMGLGLGIDYGLFIVTRYREEVAAGRPPAEAAIASVRTAGRTVLFSAFTVAAALSATLVFPLFFLRSFGYAGITATLTAAFAAVFVLPALLVAWSKWLSRLDLRKPLRRALRMGPPPPAGLAPADGGIWRKIALVVMRRPIVLGGSVVVLLVLVGLPFFGVRFGLPDDRSLPPNSPSHLATVGIERDFGKTTTDNIAIVSTSVQPPNAVVGDYERRLSLLPNIQKAEGPAGTWVNGKQTEPANAISDAEYVPWGGSYVNLTPTVPGYSPEGEKLVHQIRAMPSPYAITLVGGNSASLVDTEHGIAASLPLAGGIMVTVTLILLFLFTGSVFLPIKAIAMTLLSLTATFGIMVWGFQDGHLSGILHFTPTGTLDTTIPILMFCVVFGLSMDYEVFLLSRVKEEYDATGDNIHAVATGLEKTGRVVSSAALLLAVVFAAFMTSQVQFIQLLGVGAFVAVLVDATLVRAVLVPAFMRLMGASNWWAPKPLKKLWEAVGLKDAVDELPGGTNTEIRRSLRGSRERAARPRRKVLVVPRAFVTTRPARATGIGVGWTGRPSAGPVRHLDYLDPAPGRPLASTTPVTAEQEPFVYREPVWERERPPVPYAVASELATDVLPSDDPSRWFGSSGRPWKRPRPAATHQPVHPTPNQVGSPNGHDSDIDDAVLDPSV